MPSWLPTTQQLIDMAIVITVLEVLVLWLHHRYTGAGLPPGDYLCNVAAGLALMLALRASVTGAGWVWVAAGLLAAGVAHAADMRRRWPTRA